MSDDSMPVPARYHCIPDEKGNGRIFCLRFGAMESTCRQYQCRFKRPGQFWTQTGDEALICLETFWRNDRWHQLFPHCLHGDPCKN